MPSANADTSVARRFHAETSYTLAPVPGQESEIMAGIPPNLRIAIGEQELVAMITRSSTERLGLKVGDSAIAVIKSTEVMIGKGLGNG